MHRRKANFRTEKSLRIFSRLTTVVAFTSIFAFCNFLYLGSITQKLSNPTKSLQLQAKSPLRRSILLSFATHITRKIDLISTIHSILSQNILPEEILINFANGTNYPVDEMQMIVSAPLSKLPLDARPQVYFQACDPRWKSAAKMLGALQHLARRESRDARVQSSEWRIVYADDDMIYPDEWLESLVAGHDMKPGCAVGLRGWRVRADFEWGVPAELLASHLITGDHLRAPYRVGVLTGGGGVLVLPSHFGGRPPRPPAPEAALLDDIWLSSELSAAGIERWVVPGPPPPRHLGQDRSVIDGQLLRQDRKVNSRLFAPRQLSAAASQLSIIIMIMMMIIITTGDYMVAWSGVG